MNMWQRFLQRQTHRQSRNLDKQQEQGMRQQWFCWQERLMAQRILSLNN